MGSLLKQLQSLLDLKLSNSIVRLCDFALSSSEQKPEFLPPLQKLQVLLIYADALYETGGYWQAETNYRQALQLQKHLKSKSTPKTDSQELASDVEIKYKIYKCCMALKQTQAALEILQFIAARARTAKINLALADLYRNEGMDRLAMTCYKEVLRENPFALDAAENLLKLGTKGVEVNSLMVGATTEYNFLNLWLRAQAFLHSRDFNSALELYKVMDSNGVLKDNPYILVNMGYCYHYLNETNKAILVLQRALKQDEHLVFGRDLLSTLLANLGNSDHVRDLEKLIPVYDMCLWKAEHWVALGNHMFATKKYERAAYFGQQALSVSNSKNVEALLLKARTLLEINKYQDAAQHCTEAIQICPFRFDFYQCLVECYVKLNRLREADSMAQNACKQLNYSAQSLTLHASVLLKDPMTSGKAVKKMLDKAVGQGKTCSVDAVCMLVEYLDQEQQYEQALQLLIKYIEHNPSSRLHQLLGDCYVNLQKDDEAFHHYNIALKLDPSNQRAIEGLNSFGRNLALNKHESSYYTCLGEPSRNSSPSPSEEDAFVQNDGDSWSTINTF